MFIFWISGPKTFLKQTPALSETNRCTTPTLDYYTPPSSWPPVGIQRQQARPIWAMEQLDSPMYFHGMIQGAVLYHATGSSSKPFALQGSMATRQHSTQSVGNMPPPSPPHLLLLPQVLQIMPRNPKYDQFQPKGHHNEENPQSTTKMPGNSKFDPFH